MQINSHRQFARRTCPSCGTDVAGNENRCPICSYEFPQPGGLQHRFVQILTALILLAALLAWFIF